MTVLFYAAIVIAFVLIMEGVAWVSHRYIMHGWLWDWHRSHHEPTDGVFEKNDLFGVVFSIPSMILMQIGIAVWTPALFAGIGILIYGVIYFLYHDVLVHRRIDIGWRPKRGYFARVVQAHRLHHAVQSKDGCVSFGFIFAPSPQRLKKMLAKTEDAKMRVPKGAKAIKTPQIAV
ncbi:MAG: sterol desaturase family protein [Pseudomonadota bacterium]